MRRYIWTVLVIAVVALIGGSFISGEAASGTATRTAPPQVGGYCDISADELFNMLKGKDFALVNVHIPYEGELPRTDAFIPYDEIDRHLDRLPADKNARIVLYCKTDRMSRIAAERLAELGYTNVCNLDGGMIVWRQKGYPLLNATF